MSKKQNRDANLRRIIRQMIHEELARSRGAEMIPSEHEELVPDQDRDLFEPPNRTSEMEPPGPPPWAVFGSPQPAPEEPPPSSRKTRSAQRRNFNGLYEPDFDLDPPPFIPRNRDKE